MEAAVLALALAAHHPGGVVRDATSVLTVIARSPLPEGRTLATVREEGVSPEFSRVSGGRSLSAEAEVDCAARVVRLRTLRVYAEAGLRGATVSELGPLPGWRRPSGGLTMGKVVEAVCGTPPALAPAPAPDRPAVAATRVPNPADARRISIQIGAPNSEAAARALLTRARADVAAVAALEAATEPVQQGGRRYVRAVFRGVTQRSDARAICAALQARGYACLVRSPP